MRFAAIAFLITTPVLAQTAPVGVYIPNEAANLVYPGCPVPPTTFAHVWYIDPVNGQTPANGGDGSAAHPWNSLLAVTNGGVQPGYSAPLLNFVPYQHRNAAGALVTDSSGSGPIAPGDEVLLMSGSYPAVSIGNPLGSPNPTTQFVTIAGAPGQSPVIASVFIRSSSYWHFTNLTISSLSTGTLFGAVDSASNGPISNIVLDYSTVANYLTNAPFETGAGNVSQATLQATTGESIVMSGSATLNATCMAATHNTIHGVGAGGVLFATNGLWNENIVSYFGVDGLDFAGSNLLITKNNIHDTVTITEGLHPDAMQGQLGPTPVPATCGGATPPAGWSGCNDFSNVIISDNTITQQLDPLLAETQYLQGIDAWDADWTGMVVQNNAIVTSSCWGIYLAGSQHNSIVVNNTTADTGIMGDESGNGKNYTCDVSFGIGNTTHEGPPSTNSIIRNNVTASVIAGGPGVTADHNVVYQDWPYPYYNFYSISGTQYNCETQGPAPSNFCVPQTQAQTFASFPVVAAEPVFGGPVAAPPHYGYNLALAAGSQAQGLGTALGAPAVTIQNNGRPKTGGINPGAY